MTVTLQMLNDIGLNPFAVELLAESFLPRAVPGEEIKFALDIRVRPAPGKSKEEEPRTIGVCLQRLDQVDGVKMPPFSVTSPATRPTDDPAAALLAALQLVLDQVDYTAGACGVTEMVGAVLPKVVIERARAAIAKAKP